MNTSLRTAALLATSIGCMLPLAPAATPAQAAAPAPKDFVVAQGRVTASTLSVRSKPTTAATRLANLRKGAWLQPVCWVQGQSVAGNRTWLWSVNDTGHSGWVSAKYVRVTTGHVTSCASFPGFTPMDVEVNSAKQVDQRLAGTSASFRSYIAAKAAKLPTKPTEGCARGIEVVGWWKADQAIGYDNECGGYMAVWSLKNGTWHESGWNGDIPCSDIRKAGARHTIPGNTGFVCFVRTGSRYSHVQYSPKA